MKTIIAVPDFTRKANLKKILPPLLKKDTEVIIATGLHRPPTKKELGQLRKLTFGQLTKLPRSYCFLLLRLRKFHRDNFRNA